MIKFPLNETYRHCAIFGGTPALRRTMFERQKLVYDYIDEEEELDAVVDATNKREARAIELNTEEYLVADHSYHVIDFPDDMTERVKDRLRDIMDHTTTIHVIRLKETPPPDDMIDFFSILVDCTGGKEHVVVKIIDPDGDEHEFIHDTIQMVGKVTRRNG